MTIKPTLKFFYVKIFIKGISLSKLFTASILALSISSGITRIPATFFTCADGHFIFQRSDTNFLNVIYFVKRFLDYVKNPVEGVGKFNFYLR